MPRLEELKHGSPLHATYLTGIVSGLPGLSCERPLSTTNKMADQKIFLDGRFNFLDGHGPIGESLLTSLFTLLLISIRLT